MKDSFKKGLNFGVTSGIITTLGLIVGLNSGTGLKIVIIGGILTIAVADAFSDALGIHISEESSKRNSQKEIWQATFTAFITKFVIAMTFIIPFLFLNIKNSVLVSIIWGFFSLTLFNYFLARQKGEKPLWIILEHLFIAFIVILISNYVGKIISFYLI
jgi:vacuolar iron transporter family protein